MIEATKELLEVVEAAIKSGDWVVDGACEPDMAIQRCHKAIAEAEKQEPVACTPTSEFPAVKAAKLQVQEHIKYYNDMMKEENDTH